MQNIKKLEGEPLETKYIRKKVAQCRKKLKGPLVSPGFVAYVKKVKNERGPFALSFPWPDLVLIVCFLNKKRRLKTSQYESRAL